MTKETASNKPQKRAHRATYATDKRKGGYLIRVIGPHASSFVGREIPVTTRDGFEHVEKLTRLIWSGIDIGSDDNPGTGQPAALYAFESKPRSAQAQIEF